MRHFHGNLLPVFGLCLTVGTLVGCVNGPFYRMWYGKDWAADEKYGPTFYTKLEEMKKLRSGIKSLDAEEQTRVAQQLTQTLSQDPCPPYRSEIVKTLALCPAPAATEGLRLAIQDKDASVRTVACRAWGQREEQEALQVLAQAATADPDHDVRMTAVRELGKFKDQQAVRALGQALEENDPALQHLAVESLRSVTGKDFGDSVPAWRQFVRGEQVKPGEPPSLAEKLRRLF